MLRPCILGEYPSFCNLYLGVLGPSGVQISNGALRSPLVLVDQRASWWRAVGFSTSTLDSQGPLGGHNVATTTRVEPSSLHFKVTQFAASGMDIEQIASCACGSSPTWPLTVTITFQWGHNRHRGSASVVFPVEIWLLILENLALRDLYSLTVTSKFFYNNFTSIYLNRVAREGIPRRKQPTPRRILPRPNTVMFCWWMLPLSFPDYTGTDFLNNRYLGSNSRYFAH